MTWYFGIDLGTTNSAIASFNGSSVRLHKSPEQNDVTPSALYFDKRGNKFVGQRAYDSAAHAPGNAALLFKRLIGTRSKLHIEATGQDLLPEDCSAEVLRTLWGYVQTEDRDPDQSGTVITVPAAFNQLQKEATLSAARLAKIGSVAVMQEPVAAVMSVVRARKQDGRFIIFDFGGGTLDVAIAENLGGKVSLLAHGGIAMCGGRDFDRIIVDRLVEPWLRERFDLGADAFAQGSILRRLSAWAAERAKIDLASREEAVVSLSEAEVRMRDRAGNEIYLDVPVTRAAFNDAARGKLDEAVSAVRETLTEATLSAEDIDRIVFVGGPTQYKPLRDYVAQCMSIPAATDVNPMTAVAEGAAIFAESLDWTTGNRERKKSRESTRDSGPAGVEINYTARTADDRARISFRPFDADCGTLEVQVDSVDTGWSSGRVTLGDKTAIQVPLVQHGENRFKVFAFGHSGEVLPLDNSRIVIARTQATVEAIPASHSVGVEVLEKVGGRATLEFLVKRGEPLPKKGSHVVRAAEALRAGGTGSLNIKVWQGEVASPVTENLFVGAIKIAASDLEDGVIPAGADLRVDYEVLDSGIIEASVTVPGIGATFHAGRKLYAPQDAMVDLRVAGPRIDEEREQLAERLQAIEGRVEDDRLASASESLDQAELSADEHSDQERCKEAMEALLRVRSLLATVRRSHIEQLRLLELDQCWEWAEGLLRAHGKPDEIASSKNLYEGARRAAARPSGDFEAMYDDLRSLVSGILWRLEWWVIDRFREIADKPHLFADQVRFQKLVETGAQALARGDIDSLRTVLGALYRDRVGPGAERDMILSANVVRS